jgi:very-short-patch-repair endonuclease
MEATIDDVHTAYRLGQLTARQLVQQYLDRIEALDQRSAGARLAIELDGQHLSDPVAYRRDRRKDQLLQENGYFVLRFFAEDVGKNLDAVLDAILRAM